MASVGGAALTKFQSQRRVHHNYDEEEEPAGMTRTEVMASLEAGDDFDDSGEDGGEDGGGEFVSRARHDHDIKRLRGQVEALLMAHARREPEDKKIRALRDSILSGEEPGELDDDDDGAVLVHSFREDSAYYSICDPKQKRYAFTVLAGVIAMLYFVMLPGVLPLLEDEREDNHILNFVARRFSITGNEDDDYWDDNWYLDDDRLTAADASQARFCHEFTVLVAFCVVAAFADNLEPCLRGFHESIVNDKDSLDHSWFLLPFFAIATAIGVSVIICLKTLLSGQYSLVYFEAVLPVLFYLVTAATHWCAPHATRLLMLTTVLVIDLQLMTFAVMSIWLFGSNQVWYSLDFILFILIASDIDEWVHKIASFGVALRSTYIDAKRGMALSAERARRRSVALSDDISSSCSASVSCDAVCIDYLSAPLVDDDDPADRDADVERGASPAPESAPEAGGGDEGGAPPAPDGAMFVGAVSEGTPLRRGSYGTVSR